VRFVNENLLEEPRSKFFDVVVCRNVLIYFSRPMHDKVVMNLHKSLRPDGYLMLGKTESLVGPPRLHYELIDAENRIFRKKG
jgi:chemotaxis protein methyltransferase CheR